MPEHSTTALAANRPARQQSFTRDELIACGEGRLFGPGTPRLPVGSMLMVDRVTWISDEGGAYGAGEIRAELDVDPSLWFFACHFIDDPVMPGCLGLDAMWQLTGFFMAWAGSPGRGRALGVGELEFRGQITPKTKLVTYEIHPKRVIQRKLHMIVADGITKADGVTIYTAKDLKVGLFSPEQLEAQMKS